MIYPHIATVWRRGDEDATGSAAWVCETFPLARFEGLSGSERLMAGEGAIDAEWLFLPGNEDTPRDGDKVMRGFACSLKPPKEAKRVSSTEPICIGSEVHHWEVLCK